MGYKVAVVGATGNVGREILSILDEREFPCNEVIAIASANSKGNFVPFGENELEVHDLSTFDFEGVDIVLSSPGAVVSEKFAPLAVKAGAIVIDNTSCFRMFNEVPLIVPEVNIDALDQYGALKIISNPNCCAIPLAMVLKPLLDLSPIQSVRVATYQATSGAGKLAMEELFNQTRDIYGGIPTNPVNFTKQIAFNAIPHISKFMDDGYTAEEHKIYEETSKILGAQIPISATSVRIPVFVGHALSIWVDFADIVDEDKAREALSKAPGVAVVDYRADEGYVTPVECAGNDMVYVSRIRRDNASSNGLCMWVVTDNLRKGAALNAVQIAEEVIKKYL